MRRTMAAMFLLLCNVLAPGPAAAQGQPLAIEAFFGRFSGGGIASNADSLFFAVTARDFDVVIAAKDNGFKIDWTSVIRGGGTPEKPNVRRKTTSKVMVPTARRGVFHCADSGDPLAGKELCWARIEGRTLSVFLMTVNEDGVYELQQYDRTLVGTGMNLVFRRWRDGDRLRTVSGKLVKVAK